MRVNPSPFPAMWHGLGIEGYREGEGTYNGYAYNTLPPLPVERFQGTWDWLLPAGHRLNPASVGDTIARASAELGLTLSPGFQSFANDEAQHLIRSCTDYTFDWSILPVESPRGGGGYLIRFYADSQGCLFWYLYTTVGGYYCVVASPNLYEPEDGERESEITDPDAVWFCAPSFEAFVLPRLDRERNLSPPLRT